MFEEYEKKINKVLIDFVIGGSYMGDQGQHFFSYIRKFVSDAYDHLQAQCVKFKEWYDKE